MNKKKLIRMVSLYSIIYTAITLLNSVLYLCNGIYEDPSGNWHELDRDIWINFTSLFVLLCIINTVICVFKKKRRQKGERQ